MASILRQIVAGPRARHPEARLDLCYVTENIVVTSGPSSVWPTKAYRNPTDQLVAFLDKKHGENWAIFEFRAEGTGYPDAEVYNRIHHFPWPDHHPPPFAIIPNLMAAMRNWLQGDDGNPKESPRVAVVHCKAGKGRSGTSACSYLISQEGWSREDALERFTLRRMRTGFGAGVSIPSQLRWVQYVDRWTNSMHKHYVERPVEILEIHVWGLRDGVKVTVEGFVDQGRRIQNFHTFTRDEKINVDQPSKPDTSAPVVRKHTETLSSPIDGTPPAATGNASSTADAFAQNVILRPAKPIILLSSDVNVDFERRNKAGYTGLTMVTSIAHVWFNTYFEGGYEGNESGLFEIKWEAMDGIKGSARKGTRALERLQVVWKYADQKPGWVVDEPKKGEPVREGQASDWRGKNEPDQEAEAKHSDGVDSSRPGGAMLTMAAMINQGAATLGKELGLRKSTAESENVSRASSVKADESETPPGPTRKSAELRSAEEDDEYDEIGVKPHGRGDELQNGAEATQAHVDHSERQDTKVGHNMEAGLGRMSSAIAKLKPSTAEKDGHA